MCSRLLNADLASAVQCFRRRPACCPPRFAGKALTQTFDQTPAGVGDAPGREEQSAAGFAGQHTSCACVALGIPATTPRHSRADRASSLRRRGMADARGTWLCWMKMDQGFMFVSLRVVLWCRLVGEGVSWRVLRQSGCLGVLALKRPDVLKTHELRQFRKGHQASIAVHWRARALKLRIHRLHGLGGSQRGDPERWRACNQWTPARCATARPSALHHVGQQGLVHGLAILRISSLALGRLDKDVCASAGVRLCPAQGFIETEAGAGVHVRAMTRKSGEPRLPSRRRSCAPCLPWGSPGSRGVATFLGVFLVFQLDGLRASSPRSPAPCSAR